LCISALGKFRVEIDEELLVYVEFGYSIMFENTMMYGMFRVS